MSQKVDSLMQFSEVKYQMKAMLNILCVDNLGEKDCLYQKTENIHYLGHSRLKSTLQQSWY